LKCPPPILEKNKWSLTTLPPEGHPDVGPYFYQLFQNAVLARDREYLPEKWEENYRLFRGNHWPGVVKVLSQPGGNNAKLSLALLQSNITRTVANITARAPMAEVVSADGIEDEASKALSEKLRVWSAAAEQQRSLGKSVLNQEIYGITVEKAVWDSTKKQGRSIPLDPFSFVPAPGYYEELSDAPYVCHLYPMQVEEAEAKFEVENLAPDEEVSTLLGESRQDDRAVPKNTYPGSINATGNYVPVNHPGEAEEIKLNRALIIELWIKDYTTVTVEEEVVDIDPATGEQKMLKIESEKLKYPGGIRVVTISNYGKEVLNDEANPNVNHALPQEAVENSYLFDRFPFYHANSYEDTTSLWGYAMCETVGDINLAIDDLWSTIMSYLRMSMFPPLILPKDTKIPLSKVRYVPRLVLQPVSGSVGSGIKWLDMPAPPSWLFQALSTLVSFFDRISQIEDADRGEAAGGVIAASAISMLQERGAVLVRAKIRAVDYIVRERGRCFISFYQNFGIEPELVDIESGPVEINGLSLLQRKFNYVVESGSTVAKTSSQVKNEAVELFKLQAIDRQALLEAINFPNWRKIVERMGESQLQAALSVLIQAGMPEEVAREIYNQLLQDQGGPGDATQQNAPGGGVGAPGAPAEAGTPKAEQGVDPGGA
jgi:hypothetical protein